jgi:hypothetical protein
MADLISERDMELAINTYNDLTLEHPDGGMSEIARLIHNANLFEAMVPAVEAQLADAISEGYQKMPIDKIKWKARASKEYGDALKKAARAAGELGAARLRLKAAENVIEIWRTQNANNRKGHF